MALPTYEDHADLFESALITLAASDAGLGEDFTAHLVGYECGMHAVADRMRFFGLTMEDVDTLRLLPQQSHLLFGADAGSKGLFELARIDKLGFLEAQRLRSLVPLPRTSFCRVRRQRFLNSGQVEADAAVVFAYQGQGWMPIDPQFQKNTGKTKTVNDWRRGEWHRYEEIKSAIDPYPEMASIAEWGRRLCWHIQLRMPQSPALLAATDPIGVRALLRMRDLPEGRTRREALRHWVKEHWRQNRHDPSIEHQVREHLRGADRCDWFGLQCQILPSEMDKGKLEMSRLKGRVWRRRLPGVR